MQKFPLPYQQLSEYLMNRPPLTPYPFRNTSDCGPMVDLATSTQDLSAAEPQVVDRALSYSLPKPELQEWSDMTDFKELTGPMNGSFHDPNRVGTSHDVTEDDYEPPLSPKIGHCKEEEQTVGAHGEEEQPHDIHVHFETGVKRTSSGSPKRSRRRRPKPIAISDEDTRVHVWLPSPVSPNRHFRDIVAERPCATGTMYKVVWRDSWVHESRLPCVDDVREMHINQYGKSWDIVPFAPQSSRPT